MRLRFQLITNWVLSVCIETIFVLLQNQSLICSFMTNPTPAICIHFGDHAVRQIKYWLLSPKLEDFL